VHDGVSDTALCLVHSERCILRSMCSAEVPDKRLSFPVSPYTCLLQALSAQGRGKYSLPVFKHLCPRRALTVTASVDTAVGT